MLDACRGNDQALHWDNKESLATYLKAHPIHNAAILIKGSRGMSIESFKFFVKKRCSSTHPLTST